MPINKNKIKIGELLVQAKIITEEQLQLALKYQKEKGGKLGSIIVSMGFATENSLLEAISQQLNMPFLDLAHYKIDPEVVRKIPERIARRFRVLALEKKKINI
jgi:MSHA biogenesis protein MshE